MRIVIDMQGAQVECLQPDSKPSAVAFAQAVVRNKGEHKIILALSGLIPEKIQSIREAFCGIMPQADIVVWQAPGPVREDISGNEVWRETAVRIREGFLASLRPDIVHITNPFLGYEDNGVSSIGPINNNAVVSASVHEELETVVNVESTTQDIIKKDYFVKKLECIRDASLIFTSFNRVKEVMIDRLGFSENQVVNIFPEFDQKNSVELVDGDNYREISICNWDSAANGIIKCWEDALIAKQDRAVYGSDRPKQRLAFVTPMPPEKTGIADYSAELIKFLSQQYDIILIVNQEMVEHKWDENSIEIKDPDWFFENAANIDRIIYHIGNSHFHNYMLPLMEKFPGIVVLHDFYLGHLMAWREYSLGVKNALSESLYESHGFRAIRAKCFDTNHAMFYYPSNWCVLKNSLGIIVHSQFSKNLTRQWYGEDIANNIQVIPLLRAQVVQTEKKEARNLLKIANDDFVVCSFGFLGETKLNHRLLDAWVQSSLSKDSKCYLFFVGENHGGEYGNRITEYIKNKRINNRVKITGYVDKEDYSLYLQAADLAVQLRDKSRGETSAAVMDCMNYGIPLIANANGSIAELDPDAVNLIPDGFSDSNLIDALERLRIDSHLRDRIGVACKAIIQTKHSPSYCANLYIEYIEKTYQKYPFSIAKIIQSFPISQLATFKKEDLARLAADMAKSFTLKRPKKILYLDVSIIATNDIKTGIQRVIRALLLALVDIDNSEFQIQPVILSDSGGSWHYRTANKYMLGLLECPPNILDEESIEPQNGDVLLILDLTGRLLSAASEAGIYRNLQNIGVKCWAIVYDLLPILMPNVFPAGASTEHLEWLCHIAKLNGALCISKAVANELKKWLREDCNNHSEVSALDVKWFHLGADLLNSKPSLGLPKDSAYVLNELSVRPTFLMVGTIEPRKAYPDVIEAFTQLWNDGFDVNLVIVGREGWKDWISDENRRNIPATVSSLKQHVEYKKRLLWLDRISDEFLEKIYGMSSCLIAASYGEGFGLPLIEAAQYKIPIIARDIEVFREVAGDKAYYFNAANSFELSQHIRFWLSLYSTNSHPKTDGFLYNSWMESAEQLLMAIKE